jgi:hypothetical protein
MKRLYSEIDEFVKDTFPEATARDHLLKLKHEADEAREMPADITEYADCIICIFGAAAKSGFSYNDLIYVVDHKLRLLKNKDWEKLPDGTYQSIKK